MTLNPIAHDKRLLADEVLLQLALLYSCFASQKVKKIKYG